MPFILEGATGDPKAQQYPNTQPAEISRQFKPQAIYSAPGHKKTPGTMTGGVGEEKVVGG